MKQWMFRLTTEPRFKSSLKYGSLYEIKAPPGESIPDPPRDVKALFLKEKKEQEITAIVRLYTSHSSIENRVAESVVWGSLMLDMGSTESTEFFFDGWD